MGADMGGRQWCEGATAEAAMHVPWTMAPLPAHCCPLGAAPFLALSC